MRQCMYCGVPIAECMGYVLPRDALLLLEGKWNFTTMGWPRELCPKELCNEKWKQELANDSTSKTNG